MLGVPKLSTVRVSCDVHVHVVEAKTDQVLYYFVDFVPGSTYAPFLQGNHPPDPTPMTRKIILEIAKFYIQLETVSFDKAGSPRLNSDGTIDIGPVMTQFVQLAELPFYLGPFPTAKMRYLAFFDTALQQLREGTRAVPQYLLVDYLTALELRSLVEGCAELDEGPWYVKHGEDKGDYFMVDDDGNLTAVLDWDW